MKLKLIGSGSQADQWGYDFELILGWLELIRDHEMELAEEKPRYANRANKLDDLVGELSNLQ